MTTGNRLGQLRELAAEAAAADGHGRAATLAELQRVSAWALRDVVTEARASGVPWRDLAAGMSVATTTLYSQFQAGRGMIAASQQDAEPRPVRATGEACGADPAASHRPAAPALPGPGLDRFVGREQELADLRPLLSRSRLVTLTGPGGVGKTRLAKEFLARVPNSHPGGVWWADLSPLAPASPLEAVQGAVMAAVGASDQAHHPFAETVRAACGDGAALLVLDNCEHLVDATVHVVAGLLDACPHLRILTTSREALLLPGESQLPLATLPLPKPGLATAAEAREVAAVRLFADRARSVLPSFELTDDVVPAVTQLCARLDGLPLAIELAARQIRVLGLPGVVQRLDDRLIVLASGRRGAGGHHRSLRAAIEWSYDLLDKEEQVVFRRMAELPDGFDQDSAATVCADLDLSAGELWEILTSLATKSLLVPETGGRFRMLESLRVFGREQLRAAAETTAVQNRLMSWLADVTTHGPGASVTPQRVERRRETELHNLAHAVEVAEEAGDDRYPLLALALANAQRGHGRLRDAQDLLRYVTARHPHAASQPLALIDLATIEYDLGDYPNALAHAEQGRQLARARGIAAWDHRGRNALANIHRRLGDFAAAGEARAKLVASHRADGDRAALAAALSNLALHRAETGNLPAATAAIDEALALAETDQNQTIKVGPLLSIVGAIAILRGDLEQAEAAYARAVAASGVGTLVLPGHLEGFAVIAYRSGAHQRALRLFAASRALAAAAGLARDPLVAEEVDKAVADARRQLPDRLAAAATAEGAALTAEAATAYALSGEWPGRPPRGGPSPLSPREDQIAELVAQGRTTAQIAAHLSVAESTVACHVRNIKAKLDLSTRAQLVAWVTARAGRRRG